MVRIGYTQYAYLLTSYCQRYGDRSSPFECCKRILELLAVDGTLAVMLLRWLSAFRRFDHITIEKGVE